MQTAPLPANERARLRSLKKLNILDTPPEERFDRITKLATRIFNVPISTISLIDANREWFKSVRGLDQTEGERAVSFCAHALLTDEILLIPDAKKDARFFDNPMVIKKPFIRFYAGAPIMNADGHCIGVFCIKDTKPRTFSKDDKNILLGLAAWVEIEINSRNLALALAEQKKLHAKLTKREEKEKEMRIKEKAFLDSIGDGLIEVDTNGKIIEMNHAAGELLAVPPNRCIGIRYNKIWSEKNEKGEILSLNDRPIEIALTTGKKFTTTTNTNYYYVRKNGTQFAAAITVTPVIMNNRIIGVVEVFRDISKDKEIDNTKTEFVSLVSHHLKTPTGAVQWNLEMLLAGDYGIVPDQQKQALQEMYVMNTRTIELINTLLNVTRIEMGIFIIEPVPTDFAKMCDEVLVEMGPLIANNDLKLTINYQPKLVDIPADPKLLRIIFQNIISNAIKFTKKGGRVSVNLKLVGSNIVFSVTNSGEPIPQSDQSKIFQKLFRASNAQVQDPNGSGLGLYIVKQIVTKSGGQVWFTSKKGEDTLFACSFPMTGMLKKNGSKQLK